MRYVGQNYELSLAVANGQLDARQLTKLIAQFHASHRALYGYDIPGHQIEAVRLRLIVTIDRGSPPHEKHRLAVTTARQAILEKRDVWFPETGFVATPVYERTRLPAQILIRGPAIVEQMDTTVVVPPGATMQGDRLGYLHVAIAPSPAEKGGT